MSARTPLGEDSAKTPVAELAALSRREALKLGGTAAIGDERQPLHDQSRARRRRYPMAARQARARGGNVEPARVDGPLAKRTP